MARVFNASSELQIILKGMGTGMRSAAFILGLLAVTLFAFGALMTTNSGHPKLKPHFGSLGKAIQILLSSGLLLDDYGQIIQDIIDSGHVLPIIWFFLFGFISYFGLMNMLIGAFCNVAVQVSTEEKSFSDMQLLDRNLREILDYYDIEPHGTIRRDLFKVIMENTDVVQMLRKCGTDVDAVASLVRSILKRKSEIDVDDFVRLIVTLRIGKPATISDMVKLQELARAHVHQLETLINSKFDDRFHQHTFS